MVSPNRTTKAQLSRGRAAISSSLSSDMVYYLFLFRPHVLAALGARRPYGVGSITGRKEEEHDSIAWSRFRVRGD
jgi:hypothetical protein